MRAGFAEDMAFLELPTAAERCVLDQHAQRNLWMAAVGVDGRQLRLFLAGGNIDFAAWFVILSAVVVCSVARTSPETRALRLAGVLKA